MWTQVKNVESKHARKLCLSKQETSCVDYAATLVSATRQRNVNEFPVVHLGSTFGLPPLFFNFFFFDDLGQGLAKYGPRAQYGLLAAFISCNICCINSAFFNEFFIDLKKKIELTNVTIDLLLKKTRQKGVSISGNNNSS